MHADLRVLDPIWTTANITAYHGAMIYDTLFGLDANYAPQPQMVTKWGVSDDKLTYTFELRDGLKFSDGAAVTAADCVASVRRWAARSGSGQSMMTRVKDTPVVDDKTFRIVLSEPYGLVIDSLSTISTSLCYMMRKKDAETDPNQQVRETIGSGPFLYNRDETRPGNRHVYDRNPNYFPRKEPPSAMAGGKVVEARPRDLREHRRRADCSVGAAGRRNRLLRGSAAGPVDDLKKDKNLTVEVLNKTGHVALMRLNHLHPPFNNADARNAMLYLVKQDDVMRAIFGQLESWQACGSYFACGTPMTNDENTDWFKHGQDIAKAKELFQKGGYDGSRSSCCRRPITIWPIRPGCSPRNGCARPASMSTSPRWTGARCSPPRREEAAGRRRLEHLLHHRDRHHLCGSDRVYRPGGERRQGMVRLADRRVAGKAARQVGDRTDAR